MAAAPIRGPRPQEVVVRMYQVGFGDCFMVTFRYARRLPDGRSERHMLVDLGSTHSPKRARAAPRRRSVIELAAERIAEHSGGQLDVVVNTHRHRDHLSGFGDPQAAATIAALNPRYVVRPWTDDPKLAPDATAPRRTRSDSRPGAVARLEVGQQLAERVEALARGASSAPSSNSKRGKLAELALDQVKNPEAIAWLDEWAKRTDGGYLSAGEPSGIEDHIPGIRVRVLGPPTIDQLPDITDARSEDPDEFWLAQLSAIDTLTPSQLENAPSAADSIPPGPVGWIVDRLARQQVGSLARIVRTVDDSLNNTSVILLVDAGDKRLLLPGDAQIENWSWALSHAPEARSLRRLLASVDLYKVGHHGSRNATPKSLFALWGDEPDPDQPMMALLSTMPKVHGESVRTAVPRGPLVRALARRMTLVRTDAFAGDAGFVTVAAPCAGGKPFTVREEPHE